jgi:CRP/FNR family transcriptional regulator
MDEISHLVEKLQKVTYFSHLSSGDLIEIVTSGSVQRAKAGEYLFLENENCAGMYVLVQGQVNLLKTGPDGQETILNTVTPITMFNEVPVLDGGPNPVSALITKDSLLWHINCEKFRRLLTNNPPVCMGMLSVLAKRNRLLIGHYVDLSFRSIPARLAKYLLEASNDGSEIILRSQHPIREIAARVVTSPEVVSRALNSFKNNQVVHCTRQRIEVLDAAWLQDLAQIDH